MTSGYSTVAEALKHHVQLRGENTPYFIFRDRHGGRQEFTLGRVHLLAGRCAAFLRNRGVVKGSRVMLSLVNSPERLVCEWGVQYAGAVCVNGVHQMTDGSDLIHSLRHSRASLILLDPDVTHTWAPLQRLVNRKEDGTVTSKQLPDLQRVEFVQRQTDGGGESRGAGDFLGNLDKNTSPEDWLMMEGKDGVQRNDDCFVFTTSGTTGQPKLVAHPHHNYVTTMQEWAAREGAARPRPVRYQDTPLGTSGGNVTVPLMTQDTRVLCDVRAGLHEDPEERAVFLERCLQEEGCTRATLSVTDLMALRQRIKGGERSTSRYADKNSSNGTSSCNRTVNGNNHPANRSSINDNDSDGYYPTMKQYVNGGSQASKWGQLDQISLGGQPVTQQAVEAALELARAVMVYYGTTELALVSVGVVTRPGSFQDFNVGKPMPGIEVKVVDEKTGAELPEGQIGQVLVRHPLPFTRYLYHHDDHPHHQNNTHQTNGATSTATTTATTTSSASPPGPDRSAAFSNHQTNGTTSTTTTTTTTTTTSSPSSSPPGPDRSAAFTADGFYRTGDRGRVNPEDRSLTIFGRTGDAVIHRGARVCYPHVLESAIAACPGVADVAVVGVPDPLLTEEFCACVVLREGVGMAKVEEQVKKTCAGPGVTLFPLRPRYYLRFQALPQLYTGRPDRRRIKELALERLAEG